MGTTDIIVIGGGVVGLTVARRLAVDGARVVLLERNTCGGEASWAGAGILSPCNPHRDDPLAELQERSLAAYPELCQTLVEETGIDPEYERGGELTLYFTENTLNIARSDERIAGGRLMPDGQPVYAIHSASETGDVEPWATTELCGSLECRQTAQVRNPRLLQALLASCEKHGVDIREGTTVTDFVVEGDRVRGVCIGESKLAADAFVLCAGAWSSGIGNRLATLMPVHPVRGQIILLKLAERPFARVISTGKSYVVPRRDGHLLLGSTEEPEAGFSKRNTASGMSQLMETALRLVPKLSDAPVVTQWAGLRPGTPSGKPYVGAVPGFDGLLAATGHFRAGLTLAPATAEVIAATIKGTPYDLDLPWGARRCGAPS